MLARIRNITFDCTDPELVGRFWGDVLGYVEHPDDPNAPGDDEWALADPRGLHPDLVFVRVPEPKTAKNRLHVDLQPFERRDDAVDRVVALGGTVVADHRRDDGTGLVVLADPEGNELCIERSGAERGVVPASSGVHRMAFDRTAGERDLLLSMLEWYREAVLRKVAGASDHVAHLRPGRSMTSIAGLVKHLAIVEDGWFTESFAGRRSPWSDVDWDSDPDWEFRTALDEPLAESVARYREACDRSRAIVAEHGLDELGADGRRPPFTLRFAVLHLVEETARHLGHVDVLRELLDGFTGD